MQTIHTNTISSPNTICPEEDAKGARGASHDLGRAIGTLQVTTFPNPATERVTFVYQLPVAADKAELEVFGPQGIRLKHVELREQQAAGTHKLDLSVADIPPGLYTVVLTAAGRRVVGQLTVQRP